MIDHGWLAILACSTPLLAAGPPESEAAPLVRMRVVSDVTTVVPGHTFHLVGLFEIADHWHIYWRAAGASGAPTSIHAEVPEGIAVGDALFPRPTEFEEGDGTTYGYERETAIFLPIHVPEDFHGDELAVTVSADWLVCRDRCYMGEGTVEVAVPVIRGIEPRAAEHPAIERFRGRLPQPLSDLAGATVSTGGARLRITGPLGTASRADFLPIERPGVRFGPVESRTDGEAFTITSELQLKPRNALGGELLVEGLLVLGTGDDDPCYTIHQTLVFLGGIRPRDARAPTTEKGTTP